MSESNQGVPKARFTRWPGPEASPRVSIVMGSDSDHAAMRGAADALRTLLVPYEIGVVSAHRTPRDLFSFATGVRSRGIRVVIAGSGGAAHLPGMVAALTEVPVVGVPVVVGTLQGNDALLSIVQMPRGVPVATVAIGGSYNAGLLAAQILGAGGDAAILDRVRAFKDDLERTMQAKRLPAE